MIDPIVRPANSADRDEVGRLEAAARADVSTRRGGRRWIETHAAHGGNPAGSMWVGTIDDVVIAYLVLEIVDDVAKVTDVYVDPGAREVGFGDELLAAALAAARSAGASVLEAEALPGDRDTKNLYERAGITARLITVSTAL
ncbi:MAG: GNAT family N-acetyltransferase [Ilumatobacteraceae bacterium]